MDVRGVGAQVIKFGIVGVVASLIDYAILMLLTQVLGWDVALSSALSFSISLVFNYLASMRYVFSRREGLSRRREFVVFVALSLIGLLLNVACMWVGTLALGDAAVAVTVNKVIATAVVSVWNFCSRKKWLDAS